MTNTTTLAELSRQVYSPIASSGIQTDTVNYQYLTHETDISISDNVNASGFTAHSFYSEGNRNLVIAFAGTNPDGWTIDHALDVWADVQLAASGATVQDSHALRFASEQIANAKALFGDDISITFTGHSLGGYLAQLALQELGEGTATVFNSPGFGGGILGSEETNGDVSYVYSDPFTWGAVDRAIHLLGDHLSDNVQFLLEAIGHGILEIVASLTDGRLPLSAEQWGAIIAEGIRTGSLEFLEDVVPILSAAGQSFRDIVRGTVIEAMRDSGVLCFRAGTEISLYNGSSNVIEEIGVGEAVISYDATGTPVPGRVTKLFRNTTSEFIRLSFDDREDLVATPGHRLQRNTPAFGAWLSDANGICGTPHHRNRHSRCATSSSTPRVTSPWPS